MSSMIGTLCKFFHNPISLASLKPSSADVRLTFFTGACSLLRFWLPRFAIVRAVAPEPVTKRTPMVRFGFTYFELSQVERTAILRNAFSLNPVLPRKRS